MPFFNLTLWFLSGSWLVSIRPTAEGTSLTVFFVFVSFFYSFRLLLRRRPRAVRADDGQAGPRQPGGGRLRPPHVHHGEDQHLHQVRVPTGQKVVVWCLQMKIQPRWQHEPPAVWSSFKPPADLKILHSIICLYGRGLEPRVKNLSSEFKVRIWRNIFSYFFL